MSLYNIGFKWFHKNQCFRSRQTRSLVEQLRKLSNIFTSTSVAPDLVSPGVICLGGCCLAGAWCLHWLSWRLPRFGDSTCAELCGVAGLSWVLKREDVCRSANTTRIQMFMCDSRMLHVWFKDVTCVIQGSYICVNRSTGGTEGTTGW